MNAPSFLSLRRACAWLAGLSALLCLALFPGCDIQSADKVVRVTAINIAGYYTDPDSGRIVSQNTGAPVTSLNILQSGDSLQAIDNNGIVFKGSIGADTTTEATLTLKGVTTAGQSVTLTGRVTGSGTTGTLTGTWIEPTLYGTVYARATIAGGNGGGGGGGTNVTAVAISPSGTIAMAVGSTRVFNAAGGSGTYVWSLSSETLGTLSATTGSSVTYAAARAGTQRITVSDGRRSAATSITQATP